MLVQEVGESGNKRGLGADSIQLSNRDCNKDHLKLKGETAVTCCELANFKLEGMERTAAFWW